MYFKKFYLAFFLFLGSVNSINFDEGMRLLDVLNELIKNDFNREFINSGSENDRLTKKGLAYLYFITFDQNIPEKLYKNEEEKKQMSENENIVELASEKQDKNFKLQILINLFKTKVQSSKDVETEYLEDVHKIFDKWMIEGVFERVISVYLSGLAASNPNQKWDCKIKLDGKFITDVTYTVTENQQKVTLGDAHKAIIEEKINEIRLMNNYETVEDKNKHSVIWNEIIKSCVSIYQTETSIEKKGETIQLALSHLLYNSLLLKYAPAVSHALKFPNLITIVKIMEDCSKKPIDHSSLDGLIFSTFNSYSNFKFEDKFSFMNKYGSTILLQLYKNLSVVELLKSEIYQMIENGSHIFIKYAEPALERVGHNLLLKNEDRVFNKIKELFSPILNPSKDSDGPLSGIQALSNFFQTLCISGYICSSIFNDNASIGGGVNSNLKGDLSLDIFIGWRGNQDCFPILKKCFLNSIIVNLDHTIGTKLAPTNLSILFVPDFSKANLYFFIGFKILLENAKKSGLHLGIIVIL